MAMMDYEKRWVYHGSLTTPPCSPFIFWNVMRRVMPIRQDQFDAFKAMLSHHEDLVGNVVNNRNIQPIVSQNVRYVGAMFLSSKTTLIFAIVSSVIGYIVYA